MQIVDKLGDLLQNNIANLFQNNISGLLNKKTIGLDIGSNLIKIVSAELDGAEIVLNNLAIATTPPDALEEGKIADLDALGAKIEELLANNGFEATHVVTAISGEELIIRMVEIPAIPKEELPEAVKWEAQEQLPMSLENVILDYEIINKKENGSYELMLVAVDRDIIDSYLELFERLDLKALAIEIEPLALIRALEHLYPGQTLAIIDMGASTTDVSICSQGQLLFTRTISVGGSNITEEVADNHDLELEEAEEYKCNHNLFEEELGLIIRNLTTTIYRSLDYFQVKFKSYNIEQIVLTGGGSRLIGFAEHLSEEFGIEVNKLELLDSLRVEIENSKELAANQLLGVSVGLALRGVRGDD
ncbi:type IV pilus assembly protein PilM [Natroniella sulfidigena]|uniref:type IV pilus assembly protein PilM n=1 Tax=Natroniella sulfidigena TaxID=723921 RepID=UPI00200A94AE|nr:type IV pilus assembly protein PilM [Natroniella sulfidigena]MCK8816848.1 type IV pilus assembly protein PilM [Natroniella sulfidigena]